MPIRWILGALALAIAVGAGTALLRDGEPQRGASAPSFPSRDAAARDSGWSPSAGHRPALAAAPRPEPAREETTRGAAPATPAQIQQEMRRTDAAIASSQRISAPPESESAARRPPAGATGAAGTLCLQEGNLCHSSADCCAGLACAGGVAGYGTAGRCLGPGAR